MTKPQAIPLQDMAKPAQNTAWYSLSRKRAEAIPKKMENIQVHCVAAVPAIRDFPTTLRTNLQQNSLACVGAKYAFASHILHVNHLPHAERFSSRSRSSGFAGNRFGIGQLKALRYAQACRSAHEQPSPEGTVRDKPNSPRTVRAPSCNAFLLRPDGSVSNRDHAGL